MPGPERPSFPPQRFFAQNAEKAAGAPNERPRGGTLRTSDTGAFGSVSPRVLLGKQEEARQGIVTLLERRARLLQEAAVIREGVRQSLLAELPPSREEIKPRVVDVQATKEPLRPTFENRAAITRTWQDRLAHLTSFQARLSKNTRWQEVERRFLARKETLCKGLFSTFDPRREVFVRLAAYLSDEEMRRTLLSDIDRVTRKETASLVKQARHNGGRLDGFAFVVVGTGVHGANAAIELQAFTGGEVLAIDARDRRGGLFRSFTPLQGPDIPAFEANSRDNRRHRANRRSLAGGQQNLNPFTDEAPIQTVAFDRSSYPGNHILAAAVAVNSYLAGPALQGARVVGVRENLRKREEDEALLVQAQVGETSLRIPAFGVEIATGLGTFTVPNPDNDANMARIIRESGEHLQAYLAGSSNRLPQVVTGQGFLQMAATRKADLFRNLINKIVVVAGKRDTAQIVLAALLGDAPDKRLYGDYVTQEGGPDALYWIGPQATDRQQLLAELALRPRYARVAVDYQRTVDDPNAALIPLAGRVVRFGDAAGFRAGSFDVALQRPSGRVVAIEDADLLISCTGQINDQTTELLFPLTNYAPLRTVQDEEGTPLFREVPDYEGRVLLVGPAASLSVSEAEKAAAPALEQVGENAVAIWLNTEKVVIASRELARQYTRALVSEVEEIPF